MPTMDQHQSNRSTKLLLLGDSGSGKTGALASLAKAGYQLCILDYDNGLDSLKTFAKRGGADLSKIEYHSLRDKIKGMSTDRPLYEGIPNAFSTGMKLLDKWDDGSKPADWSDDVILVLDSLTHFGNAAYAWARAMAPGVKDPRQWFYAAQTAVENALALLTADSFHPNVIVCAHITYQEIGVGTTKGFPTSVGKALGPKLMTYFNNVAQVNRTGTGKNARREIETLPTNYLDLKNPAPFEMADKLPIETGLADYFRTVRG